MVGDRPTKLAVRTSPVSSEAGKLNVFISYSRDDIDFADQLDATLKIGGFDTTIDRYGIQAGEDWKARLGALVRDADTIVFVLTPNSAKSDICAWEVEEARRLGKRIMPVVPGALDETRAPPGLAALNYIHFYNEPKKPGSGFGSGLLDLVQGLKTDLDWLREHTRLLQRATEWDAGGRTENRLLSGADITAAKAWVASKPKDAPEPTALHLDFLRAAEEAELRRADTKRLQLEEIAAAQAEREKAIADAEAAIAREATERTGREEAQRRRARLRNILLLVMTTTAVISALSLYKIIQGNLLLANQVQLSTAAAARARTAEGHAQSNQRRAQQAEFKAIINECEASEQLLKFVPQSPENLNNYMSCGVRLGFALIRENRAGEAIKLFNRLRDTASSNKPDPEDSVRPFYLLIASQGASIAGCVSTPPKSAARSAAIGNVINAANEVLQFKPPAQLAQRWREELFRGLLYLSNLSHENGDEELAFQYASKLVDRLSFPPFAGEDATRDAIRALDHLVWMALMTKRFRAALEASEQTARLANNFGIKDLSSIRLNRAHALLFNGRTEDARIEYRELNPDDVTADVEKLVSAGLCNSLFSELVGAPGQCSGR
jgi:TIR domain